MLKVKTMQAKYYVYWNLHKNVFSVKYKGKVIAHLTNFYGTNCEFRVSEKGRQRVLAEKKKNVHSYVVCDSYAEGDFNPLGPFKLDIQGRVRYNPYKGPNFVNESGDKVERAYFVRFDIQDDKPVLTTAKLSW